MQKKLDSTCALVKVLLEEEPACRNSDEILYSRVLDVLGFDHDMNFNAMPIGQFLTSMHIYNLPKFETVRRSRQKLQASFPNLSADKYVEDARKEMEAEYHDFACMSIC